MTGPSRVLLVLDCAERAGTERHVLWLARGLKDRGWDVAVAVSRGGPLERSFRESAVPVHVVARRWSRDPLYILGLLRLARRLRTDILHAHSGRMAALAGRLARISVVIETRHGLGAAAEPPDEAQMRREARCCRIAHRTVTVCVADRHRLIAAGLPARRTICIPNGIPGTSVGASPPAQSPAEAGRIRLGFLGRLSPEKSPLFLVDLARHLDERAGGRWELSIAGDGPLRDAVERGLAPYAKRGCVAWLGETDGPAPLLNRIDLLLVPSRREGQPLVILEAMQAGVAVMAHKIPSLEEMLGGEPAAGILLAEDPRAWVEAILSLSENPDSLRPYVTEGASRVASRHSLQRMVDSIELLYRESFVARGAGW